MSILLPLIRRIGKIRNYPVEINRFETVRKTRPPRFRVIKTNKEN